MDKYKVIAIKKEDLENSISGLSQLKPVMEKRLLILNYEGKGKEDAEELGRHFETAINAMISLLAVMENGGENLN